MVVSKNGELVLATLEDLKILLEAETQELYEQFNKYKKYEKELEEVTEWEKVDTNSFISGVETLVSNNRLSKDNEYKLAVYIGRYPSYFSSIKNSDSKGEDKLRGRLEALKGIQSDIEDYIKVLIELE